MRRTLRTLTVAALVLLATSAPALAGGGGGHDAGRCPGFADAEQVLLRDGCIEGTAHFLPEGSDLTVVNRGMAAHDYTAVDGSFRTGMLEPGESATLDAPAPGVYRVYCTLHASAGGAGMSGVLVVGDLDAEALAAASAPAPGSGGGIGGLTVPAGWLATGAVVGLAVLPVGVLLVMRRRTGALPAEPGA